MKQLPIEDSIIQSLLEKGVALSKEQEALSSGSVIQLMRRYLGMTQRQLAKRAQIPQSTVARIEKGVTQPNVTSLRKIFAAMECDIAILPLPRFKNVHELLKKRAERIAKKRIKYLEGTMALEEQKPEKKWREQLLKSEIEQLLKTPSILWEDEGN